MIEVILLNFLWGYLGKKLNINFREKLTPTFNVFSYNLIPIPQPKLTRFTGKNIPEFLSLFIMF